MAEFITTTNAEGKTVEVSHEWIRRWPEDYPEATEQLRALESAGEADGVTPPPREGKGSGVAAWRAYAIAKGFEVTENAKREDIWALLDGEQPADVIAAEPEPVQP